MFKGEQRSNREEVAVKVVSLQNHAIHDSKWVQEQMANFRDENGCDPTEEERLNIYRQKVRCNSNLNFKTKPRNGFIYSPKVLMELNMTQSLSSRHIYFFVGYYTESSTYEHKVTRPPHAPQPPIPHPQNPKPPLKGHR